MAIRASLVVLTVSWTLVAFAHTTVIAGAVWPDGLVVVLAFLAACSTAALAISPGSRLAFQWGGTIGVGSISLRILTILMRVTELTLNDLISSLTINLMFLVVYWQFWLSVIGAWHVERRPLPQPPEHRRDVTP